VAVEPEQVLPASRQSPENTQDPVEDTGEFPGISLENAIDHPEKILSNTLPDNVYQTEAAVHR
jgi:hypothetical protein